MTTEVASETMCEGCGHPISAHTQVNDHHDCTSIYVDPVTGEETFCKCERPCCFAELCTGQTDTHTCCICYVDDDRISALKDPKPMACYILYRDGKCLMESRPDLHRSKLDPYWVYPGGKVEPDEYPGESAVRECMEELGMRVTGTYLLEPIIGPNLWTVFPYVFVYWDGEIPVHTLDHNHALLSWRPPYLESGPSDGSTCVREIADQIVRRIGEIEELSRMTRRIMAHL